MPSDTPESAPVTKPPPTVEDRLNHLEGIVIHQRKMLVQMQSIISKLCQAVAQHDMARHGGPEPILSNSSR
jgi:hypothetical protein